MDDTRSSHSPTISKILKLQLFLLELDDEYGTKRIGSGQLDGPRKVEGSFATILGKQT